MRNEPQQAGVRIERALGVFNGFDGKHRGIGGDWSLGDVGVRPSPQPTRAFFVWVPLPVAREE